MYKKQDSNFWWAINDYVQDEPSFLDLSADDKVVIEQIFRITYYGLFQYQLYTGKELTSIESSNIQELSDYILKNYSLLFRTVYKDSENKVDLKVNNQSIRTQQLLEKIIFPYINDHSFVSKDDLAIDGDLIFMILMQLCFKNRYDINLENKNTPDKPYFSALYPFLLTLLIVNPTTPELIYQNINQVFNKENIHAALISGRVLSESEKTFVAPLLDTLASDEDFQAMLFSFNEDHWRKLELDERFKSVYQLSKYTSILLKDNIRALDQLESEVELNALLHNYLDIILKSEAEWLITLQNDSIQELDSEYDETATFQTLKFASPDFLYPILTKDFNPKTIIEYYNHLPRVNKIKFSAHRLEKFINGILYAVSYLRLVQQTSLDCPAAEDLFIMRKKVALVNSLKLFSEDEQHRFQTNNNYWVDNLDTIFLTSQELKTILEENNKKNKDLTMQLKEVLRIISFLISLEPKIVKEMDYSLEEIIKYYLICFGPYQSDGLAFQKSDIKELNSAIKKLDKQLNIEQYSKQNDDYYSTFYLINKLLAFKKNRLK
ncbi:hypothetical protein LD125_00388 [Mesoplasma sp. JKS002658]|uniref:hypothetical protein n=1 Tax=Mesoplasma whartonense TaxID=2878854 RepID=UPI0020229E93|nr:MULTISPECIES: hypothetical protein [unclassified Mesoplasma]MCL8211109.1 hypothetical protein [Mesoplasma sp. JKS002664]MCL8211770.1 hypothetical protein [Mesoplasma sp. JKS002662]MCL8213248.1 hypothetical protein [Mesoplasma sp. JKS002660]MCL8214125.1 hypothetical protein [Mesoplasma sp. JKS002658]MCL8214447.1 hypothetical protein [Mesoplasma sp. JKS002663]